MREGERTGEKERNKWEVKEMDKEGMKMKYRRRRRFGDAISFLLNLLCWTSLFKKEKGDEFCSKNKYGNKPR